MNSDLKRLLEQAYDLCDHYDHSPQNTPDKRANKRTREILQLDVSSFVMYLSASDGRVNYTEANYVSDLLGFRATPDQITQLIKDVNIYSTEFEQRPPLSLQIFLREDNRMIAAGMDSDKYSAQVLIDLFGMIGKDIITSDNDVAANERSDFNIYIGMMQKFVDQHLNTSSQKSAPVQNTLKSQYQILKKK